MRCYDAKVASALEERVVKILCEKLLVNREHVTHSSSLETDLGADSLTIVELIMTMEEELGITIPDEDTQKMKTVGDLLDYIFQHYPGLATK